jgi:hypothetical protein
MRRPALLLASLLLSCASPSRGEPAGSPGDSPPPASPSTDPTAEDAAIDAFKTAWTGQVVPALPDKEQRMGAAIDESMRAGKHRYSARREPCRALAGRAPRTNDITGHDFVMFGRTTAVDRDGECWAVTYHGDMKHEVLGVLDEARTLLVVWRIPEG